MNAALLFASTFFLVLALGLQQQFVTDGHYIAAFSNSALIALGQIGAIQVINASGPAEYAAYMLGGPFGIICSMALYRRHFKRGG